jgi:2-polyprenyl-6-methoxyphenol hydroxylase-like FAD-dependent oxidoreductase
VWRHDDVKALAGPAGYLTSMRNAQRCRPDRSTGGPVASARQDQCSLPQWRTEAILTVHLEQLGGSVEHSVEVTAIDEAPDGLRVALRHADGEVENVAVGYVLGAGRAHSVTRSLMYSTLEGATYGGHFVVADARARLPSRPEEAKIHLGPTGFVLMAPLPDDRWIMFVNVDEATATAPDEGELAALVNQPEGRDAGVQDVSWTSCFRMHNRMVPRLADDRWFLLGDAGHLSSPLVEEGLNTGLMDAADIAWKLALIPRGMADHHIPEVSDHRLPDGGIVLVRPAGMIRFRASPADDAGLRALDAHLASYLVPSDAVTAASTSPASPVASIG